MRQQTLADEGFERYRKPTRRDQFLDEMDKIIPWQGLCEVIEPFYPKPEGAGRPPIGLERMLRIHFLQHWFNLSDPAVEEALYDSRAMRRFVGIDLGREPAPDETTVCNFRHLLADLLHGEETRVWGDSAYAGQGDVIREHAPKAKDFTNKKGHHSRSLTDEDHAANRTKSRVRAKVEHPFQVLKRVFGFDKVRYRGLDKNANRLFVACGLVNLYMARRLLLRPT